MKSFTPRTTLFISLVTVAATTTFVVVNAKPSEKKDRPGFTKVQFTEESELGIGVLSNTYYFSDTQKTWQEARKDCSWGDGHLIPPSSSSLDTILKDLILQRSMDPAYTTPGCGQPPPPPLIVWTDGKFDTVTTKWVWYSNGRAFQDSVYNKWSPGQPGVSDSTSCMAASGTGGSYGWQNYNCNAAYFYVCQTPD